MSQSTPVEPSINNSRAQTHYDLDRYQVVPRRYYGRITASAVILMLLALLVNAFLPGNI